MFENIAVDIYFVVWKLTISQKVCVFIRMLVPLNRYLFSITIPADSTVWFLETFNEYRLDLYKKKEQY